MIKKRFGSRNGFNLGNVLALVGLLLIFALPSRAQLTTATYYGVVTDGTGASIVGASVSLQHEGTGAVLTRSTGVGGDFVFDFLRVGEYSLTIEAGGFKKHEVRGIQLLAGQNARQTFTMELGSISETVSVEGAAPLVNTVSSEQMQTFEVRQVTELPLARRNFSSLLGVGAGVTRTSDGVRLNGAGKAGTSFNVDGTDASGNSDFRSPSTYGGTNYIDVMSIEAVQEVQTVKGVIQAEYGNVTGGQVNLVSKSGTNEWHGSLFENFQSNALNARHQRLTNKPGLTFNQFGGSIGGPIKRDRVFVFGVFEGYREAAFQLVQSNVPTPLMRNAMLQGTPSYALLLDHIPLPTEPYGATANVGLYRQPGSGRRTDNHALVKADYRLTDLSQIAITYSRGRPYRLEPRYYINGANDREFFITQERITANFITGGSNWTSESRVGFNYSDTNREDRFFFEQIDPLNSSEQLPFGRRVARIATNLGWSSPDHELWGMRGRNWNFDQKYARHVGGHALKFGVSWMRDCCDRSNPEAANVLYTGLDDLRNNIPSEVAPVFGNGDYSAAMDTLGFFAQDNWRVSPNLSLNLGLRYDYFGNLAPKGSETNREAGFYNPDGLLDAAFNVGPIRDIRNPYESDVWANLGPRFGFSYDPGGRGKMVIRGGFSVLFSSQIAGNMRQSAQPGPDIPFRLRFSRLDSARLGLRWPAYNDDIARVLERDVQERGVLNTFSIFDPKIQNPYTMQYSLGIQREITPTLALETAFVGMQGRKFPMHRWANQVNRETGLRPNPLLNVNYYVDHSQTTSYASWQSSLRKRYSRNLSGSLHYTWGKSLSTAGGDISAYYQGENTARTQSFFDPRADRGPSTGDITHYLAAEWVYELPRFANVSNKLVRHALGGWQAAGILTAETGAPVMILQPTTIEESRADYIGGPPILSDYRLTLQYLNRAAFAPVPINSVSRATIRPGNVGNGAIREPGAWNLDFSIAKHFSITERTRLQLRTDMFNAFNHTNLTGLRNNINDPLFGQLLNTRGARIIQLNARLSW